MASSSIKEEKIDIKQGPLDMPGEKWLKNLKPWKKCYFVFSQIRRGDSSWLKLFYYKNRTWYKEGKMPKDFIDITNASSIGMVDKAVGGNDHIISITAPGKTYYLSASSCDDRSQWLLALRAYKFNDKSRLPSTPDRTYSWHGRSSSCSEAASRKISEPARAYSMASMARIEKFKDKFMVCLKCKGIDVPREVYEWVRPESSEIYAKMYQSHEILYTSQPPDKPDSYSERIYEEVRHQDPCENMITREPLPLPCEKNTTECAASVSMTGSWDTSIEHSIPKVLFDGTLADVSEDNGENSPCTHGDEEYVAMSARKACTSNDNQLKNSLKMGFPSSPTPLSMSSSLDVNKISDDQHLGKNQELPKSSSKGRFNNEFLSKKTSFLEDVPNYVEFNRYSSDQLVRRSMNFFIAKREELQSSKGVVKSVESAIPSSSEQNHENREGAIPSEEQNSKSVEDREALKSRFNIIDPVFIANI